TRARRVQERRDGHLQPRFRLRFVEPGAGKEVVRIVLADAGDVRGAWNGIWAGLEEAAETTECIVTHDRDCQVTVRRGPIGIDGEDAAVGTRVRSWFLAIPGVRRVA